MCCKLNRLIAGQAGPSFASLSCAKKCSGTACFSSAQEQPRERLERLVGTLWRESSPAGLFVWLGGSFPPARLASYYVSWRLSRGISRCRAGSMWVSRLIKSCRRRGKKRRGTTRDSDENEGGRGPERGRRGHKEGRRRISRTMSLQQRPETCNRVWDHVRLPPHPVKSVGARLHRRLFPVPPTPARPAVSTHLPRGFFTEMFHVVFAKTGDSHCLVDDVRGKSDRDTNGGTND